MANSKRRGSAPNSRRASPSAEKNAPNVSAVAAEHRQGSVHIAARQDSLRAQTPVGRAIELAIRASRWRAAAVEGAALMSSARPIADACSAQATAELAAALRDRAHALQALIAGLEASAEHAAPNSALRSHMILAALNLAFACDALLDGGAL